MGSMSNGAHSQLGGFAFQSVDCGQSGGSSNNNNTATKCKAIKWLLFKILNAMAIYMSVYHVDVSIKVSPRLCYIVNANGHFISSVFISIKLIISGCNFHFFLTFETLRGRSARWCRGNFTTSASQSKWRPRDYRKGNASWLSHLETQIRSIETKLMFDFPFSRIGFEKVNFK